jgi:Na+-transporting methylmalonyl-CoA/oxaloacetate decarboxylase gamma subunit
VIHRIGAATNFGTQLNIGQLYLTGVTVKLKGKQMGIGAVGVVMLFIVLIYYLRMVGRRAVSRQHKDQVSLMLEKIAILESVAQDQKALLLVEQALQTYSHDHRLSTAKNRIQQRLNNGGP